MFEHANDFHDPHTVGTDVTEFFVACFIDERHIDLNIHLREVDGVVCSSDRKRTSHQLGSQCITLVACLQARLRYAEKVV